MSRILRLSLILATAVSLSSRAAAASGDVSYLPSVGSVYQDSGAPQAGDLTEVGAGVLVDIPSISSKYGSQRTQFVLTDPHLIQGKKQKFVEIKGHRVPVLNYLARAGSGENGETALVEIAPTGIAPAYIFHPENKPRSKFVPTVALKKDIVCKVTKCRSVNPNVRLFPMQRTMNTYLLEAKGALASQAPYSLTGADPQEEFARTGAPDQRIVLPAKVGPGNSGSLVLWGGSLDILGLPVQYHRDFRETTLVNVRAFEKLVGDWKRGLRGDVGPALWKYSHGHLSLTRSDGYSESDSEKGQSGNGTHGDPGNGTHGDPGNGTHGDPGNGTHGDPGLSRCSRIDDSAPIDPRSVNWETVSSPLYLRHFRLSPYLYKDGKVVYAFRLTEKKPDLFKNRRSTFYLYSNMEAVEWNDSRNHGNYDFEPVFKNLNKLDLLKERLRQALGLRKFHDPQTKSHREGASDASGSIVDYYGDSVPEYHLHPIDAQPLAPNEPLPDRIENTINYHGYSDSEDPRDPKLDQATLHVTDKGVKIRWTLPASPGHPKDEIDVELDRDGKMIGQNDFLPVIYIKGRRTNETYAMGLTGLFWYDLSRFYDFGYTQGKLLSQWLGHPFLELQRMSDSRRFEVGF